MSGDQRVWGLPAPQECRLQGKDEKKEENTKKDGSLELESRHSGAVGVTGGQVLWRTESHSPLPSWALTQQLPDWPQKPDGRHPARCPPGPAALTQAFLDAEELRAPGYLPRYTGKRVQVCSWLLSWPILLCWNTVCDGLEKSGQIDGCLAMTGSLQFSPRNC